MLPRSLLTPLLALTFAFASSAARADALSDIFDRLGTKAPYEIGEPTAPDCECSQEGEVTRQQIFPLRGNPAGGALFVLDYVPAGGVNAQSVLNDPDSISDILVFPPAPLVLTPDPLNPDRNVISIGRATFLNLFSDPFPETFLIRDPRSATTGYEDFNTTLSELLDNTRTIADIYGNPDLEDLPGGTTPRQVSFILEGTLVNSTTNPVTTTNLLSLGIRDRTVFIQGFRGDLQPYVIISDVPEPATLALLAIGMLLLVRAVKPR